MTTQGQLWSRPLTNSQSLCSLSEHTSRGMAPPKVSFPNAISVQTGACLQAPVHIGTHRHISKHKQALWAALPPNYELDHSVASTISRDIHILVTPLRRSQASMLLRGRNVSTSLVEGSLRASLRRFTMKEAAARRPATAQTPASTLSCPEWSSRRLGCGISE